MRGRETSDKVDRKLLEGAGAGGGEWRESGRCRVGVDLHLLAEGATGNKLADKRGHPQPPIVVRQRRISAKEATMTRSQRSMNGRDQVVLCRGRYIEMVFKIKLRTIEMPVRERGARK